MCGANPHSPMCLHGADRADFISALRGTQQFGTQDPAVTQYNGHRVYIPRVRTPTDTCHLAAI